MEQGGHSIASAELSSRAEGRRIAVIVLGMHRTGTSAVTGALRLLGATAPKRLMAPRASNVRGNWESQAVIRADNAVLQAGGSHWRDWSPFDEHRIPPDIRAQLETQAAEAIAADFGEAPLILLKDPRMCRLMPFWRRVLDRAGCEPRIVIPVRSPLDAALSLLDRNGMPVEEGMLLWLRHVLDAERTTRELRRCFVSFADFLEDWRTAVARMSAALQVDWPVSPIAAGADVDAFLSGKLRHHQSALDDPRLRSAGLDGVPETYDILMGLCTERPAPDAAERLDAIYRAFDQPSRVLGPLFLRRHLDLEAAAAVRERLRRRALTELVRTRIALFEAKRTVREMQRTWSWRALAPFRSLRAALGPTPRLSDEGSRREADLAQLIVESGLFDPVWYLDSNEDARVSGLDPAVHFLRFGASQGRNPSPLFCMAAYEKRYPDVVAANFNPLVHFLEHGIKENRRFSPVPGAGLDGADDLGRRALTATNLGSWG
jgi:hypothetical protein